MPHPYQSLSLLSILFKITLDPINNVCFHLHEPQDFSNKNDCHPEYWGRNYGTVDKAQEINFKNILHMRIKLDHLT